jgi:D-sedoheptulose 7-phosphate isomerase
LIAAAQRAASQTGGNLPDMKTVGECIAERRDLFNGVACEQPVEAAVAAIVRSFKGGGRVLLFGNGGSAAQAQHFAAEFSGRFLLERPAWAGLALTTDTSALTAIANDYGYAQIFARQVRAHGRAGDIAIGLSTSGESANIVEAFQAARELKITTIAFSGNGGGRIAELGDIAIVGPPGPSWKVQEVHLALGHILCELVELAMTEP